MGKVGCAMFWQIYVVFLRGIVENGVMERRGQMAKWKTEENDEEGSGEREKRNGGRKGVTGGHDERQWRKRETGTEDENGRDGMKDRKDGGNGMAEWKTEWGCEEGTTEWMMERKTRGSDVMNNWRENGTEDEMA